MGICVAKLVVVVMVAAACAPRTGQHVVTHPHGSPRWVVETVNGVPHGESRTFHPNGQLAIFGHYQRGKQHGHFTYFDSSGRVVRHAVYLRGKLRWQSDGPRGLPPVELEAIRPDPVAPLLPDLRRDQEYTLVTLGRVGIRSQARLRLGHHWLRAETGGASGRTVEVAGQVMRGAFGGYGALSLSSLARPEAESLRGKVVLEAGGAHRRPLGRFELLASAGLALPLHGDDDAGFAALTATMADRLGDSVIAYPSSIAARSSASILGVDGRVFYRLEVGLDTAFSATRGGDGLRMKNRAEVLARLSAGAGVALRRFAVSAELVNVGVLTERLPPRSAHSAALSGSLRGLRVQPFIAAVSPFASGSGLRALALVAGARHELEAR